VTNYSAPSRRREARQISTAQRLVEVIPHARAEVFSERSHSSPPHQAEPARLAEMLIDFWTHGPPAAS
jgi:hypothetical protein